MSKGIKPIIGDEVKTVTKGYVTVDGIHHPLKKGYVIDENRKPRLFFDKTQRSVSIDYTGEYTVEEIQHEGSRYDLYKFTDDGILTIVGGEVRVWICGAGANGTTPVKGNSSSFSHGGGSGYAADGVLNDGSYEVKIGKPSTVDETRSTKIIGADKEITAPGGKGINGGSAGGIGYANSSSGTVVKTNIGGSGQGDAVIPFGIVFEKKCCAGGAGGGYYNQTASKSTYGTTGASQGSSSITDKFDGVGGDTGGGDGSDGKSSGKSGSYFGSGGGGGGFAIRTIYDESGRYPTGQTVTSTYPGGSGYQGVAMALVKK